MTPPRTPAADTGISARNRGISNGRGGLVILGALAAALVLANARTVAASSPKPGGGG